LAGLHKLKHNTKGTKMKSSKKSAASKLKKVSKDRTQCAGKKIVPNFWLKLGLSREELGALRQIAQLFQEPKSQTIARAAALVLSTALMHWDKLEAFVFSDQKYADAEGFNLMEKFQAESIARKFSLKASA
jgi:hypothetical protein